MANRFWVGGTGNWSDNTNHWSATSGGSPGATLPTSSDDVFIDSSSGLSGGTITKNDTGYCKDLTSNSGLSYTLSDGGYGFDLYGSLTLENTISGSTYFNLESNGNETITTNGFNEIEDLYFYGTGTWTLQDNLTITDEFYQENGTFDANDHNVTASSFYFSADTGYTPTVILGSGTWEVIDDAWEVDEYGGEIVTIIPETSTIKLTNNSSGTVYFYEDTEIGNGGNLKTYNNIWLTGTGSGDFNVFGSGVFNDFKIDAGKTWLCDAVTSGIAASDFYVSSFTAVGTPGNLITLNTFDGTGQFNLHKTSGTVNCDYLSLSNSNVTGGALWYAGAHSLDTTNNDGWNFEKYNRIAKPTGTDYTRVNPQGKEEYDSPLLAYDDPDTFYDSTNETAWSGVSKPTGATWTKVTKPTI